MRFISPKIADYSECCVGGSRASLGCAGDARMENACGDRATRARDASVHGDTSRPAEAYLGRVGRNAERWLLASMGCERFSVFSHSSFGLNELTETNDSRKSAPYLTRT